MNHACICSADAVFARFVQLSLLKYGVQTTVCPPKSRLPEADFYLFDTDTATVPTGFSPEVLICFGWHRSCPESLSCLWIERPFRPAKLLTMLGLEEGFLPDTLPRPFPARHSVFSGRNEIVLTETEYKLYSLLWEANGKPIDRHSLFLSVWGGEGDEGIVNVYIHYLRVKLEGDGRRLIRSARGKGYFLDTGEEEKECFI